MKFGTSKLRCRYCQFGLRTLFLVTLLASVGTSWLAVKMQRARRQFRVVHRIEKNGGVVIYDFERDRPGPLYPKPEAWRLQGSLGTGLSARVMSATILGRTAIDPDMEDIADWHEVEELLLSGPVITKEGGARLSRLRQLRFLMIVDDSFTDDQLELLKGLEQLTELDVTCTGVTESGVGTLRRLLPKVHIRGPGPQGTRELGNSDSGTRGQLRTRGTRGHLRTRGQLWTRDSASPLDIGRIDSDPNCQPLTTNSQPPGSPPPPGTGLPGFVLLLAKQVY